MPEGVFDDFKPIFNVQKSNKANIKNRRQL